MSKIKKTAIVVFCLIAVILVIRLVWVYSPSEGTVILRVEEQGIDIEDSMTEEELRTAKRILFGTIRCPEWLYGYPACGFGKVYGFVLDGTLYMMSWDSCGTLLVEDDSGNNYYIDITETQRVTLQEMFDSREALASERNK